MKKKFSATSRDRKDWTAFTKNMGKVISKDVTSNQNSDEKKLVPKLDLHGFTLNQANEVVKEFIEESYEKGLKKLIIITGKGLRSKSAENPYLSEKFNVLRHSVPEYIMKQESLNNKIINISAAEKKDGGDGAIYIFLKKNKV